jgi:glycosyltransferase involved in cell wall biosynthesis
MALDASAPRVIVDGKFFRLGEERFHVKGVSYGPFQPNAAGLTFASVDQTARDFAQINDLGANTIRTYHVPPRWFLDLARQHRLRVVIDVPWNSHICFLDSKTRRDEAVDAVKRAIYGSAAHPAVLAYSVVNEIPADIVRWSGAGRIERFIDTLVLEAKKVDPNCLCTFGNFPTTEYLRPLSIDFISFNLYLHQTVPFRNYLARLQMNSDSKPLLLSEIGIDSLREGEDRKSEILSWQIDEGFRIGLAGTIVFAYTDEWWRGGREIVDWEFGVTKRDRTPKPSFAALRGAFSRNPTTISPDCPKVSIVVASYNGDRTLKACLESLQSLSYPNYEVILVDDGSTDTTRQIAILHAAVRYIRHETNLGLSVARNTGIAAASGEIVAFTDSDCRADRDWLRHLVADLVGSDFSGIGGPNLLPPEDSTMAVVVMASPGGPAHVMLTDRQAEHIPGCNMAFFKSALVEVGGFDPVFRKAGDDVDICWRLQQAGHRLGFSPSAFVWHYRRSTVSDYLKQQRGYGEAEAMLVQKHPEYFNALGGGLWRGRIYTASKFGVLLRTPIIYHGFFGSAGYQFLYAPRPAGVLMLFTSLEYYMLVSLPLFVLGALFRPILGVAGASLLVPIAICSAAGWQATLPPQKLRRWSRPLVAAMFLLQPIVRGWARYRGRLLRRPAPLAAQQTLDSVALRQSDLALDHVDYWAEQRIDKLAFLSQMLHELDKQGWPNKWDEGWSNYDVEIYGSRWAMLQITTTAEEHPSNKQMVRCRLRPLWSLQAVATFWALCALELLFVGILGAPWQWLFLPVLTIPACLWWLRREKRVLQSTIAAYLDDFAKRWKLTKIVPGSESPKTMKSPAPLAEPGPFSASPEKRTSEEPRVSA